MITPLESMWLAPAAVVMFIIATFPAWLFGRALSWVKPGMALRLPITRTSGIRWAIFVVAAIVAFMMWALGANTGQMSYFVVAAVAVVAAYFYAFMIGAGARDRVLAHRSQPDVAPIVPRKLDQMDHELIAMLDEGSASK